MPLIRLLHYTIVIFSEKCANSLFTPAGAAVGNVILSNKIIATSSSDPANSKPRHNRDQNFSKYASYRFENGQGLKCWRCREETPAEKLGSQSREKGTRSKLETQEIT